MKSISKVLGAAALVAATLPAAFADTPAGGPALEAAQPERQHRYVQIGRDRTWVRLAPSNARANSSDARLMGNTSAAPAGPSSQDLMGGPN